MNVLLIYPEFPDTFWSFKHALTFVRRKASLPPLGLLTVAAMLPIDWAKRLVDTNVSRLTDEDLAWADLIFVSGMTVQRESAHQIIARCKGAGVKVIAGGPLFTSEHEQFPEVDHFVLQEAELTLPPFLADLGKGRAKRMYATSEYADLHLTPVPLWELVLAFLRSIYRLGIKGQERVHYWRLLGWTLIRRPKLLPVAITLAICGYHFRMVAEQAVV